MVRKLTLSDTKDPAEAAHAAGLTYSRDDKPGIRRVKAGRAFRYLDPHGRPVKPNYLSRIRSLVIPPAWTSVWICTDPSGHLQATGRDARGRKQYRYHPRWRDVRHRTQYGRTSALRRALPRILLRIDRDLPRSRLP